MASIELISRRSHAYGTQLACAALLSSLLSTSVVRAQVLGGLVGNAGASGPPGSELSAQSKPKEVVLPSGSVEVPLEEIDGHPAVRVMINGRGPYLLGFETGGVVSVISPSVATAIGLIKDTASIPGGSLNLDSVAIGPARFRTLPVEVNTVGIRGDRAVLDGLLCLGAYYELLVTLDAKNSRVRFTRGTLPEPNGGDVLPLQVAPQNGQNGYQIEISVGNRRHLALFDTQMGLRGGFLSISDSLDTAAYATPPVVVGKAIGVGWETAMSAGRLRDPIQIGNTRFTKPIVTTSPALPFVWFVGWSTLREFVVTIDQQHRRVRLARSAKAVEPPPTLYSTGLSARMLMSDSTAYVVTTTLPGSDAARQGIAAGDRIISVEDQPATFGNYLAWRRRNNGSKPFRIVVQRENNTRQLVLTPQVVVP